MNIQPASDARRFQGYSRQEMAATTELTRAENPRWRWILPVTRSSRDFMRALFPLLNGSYAAAVVLIYLAACTDATVSSSLLRWWLLESVLNIAARNLLYIPIVRASPVEVARNRRIRLLPLASVSLGALHWCWTGIIFVGPTVELSVVVVLTFVMLSVATIATAPVSPLSCLTYLSLMWATVAYKLIGAHWLDLGTLALMLAALLAILSLTFHLVVSGTRRYLVQSDETELLVGDLRERNAEIDGLRRVAAEEFQTRSTFFASASHDFRQRVHALKLLALQGDSNVNDTAVLRAALTRIASVTEDLETYMTEVLEFVRLERQPESVNSQMVPLQMIFQQLELEFEDVVVERSVDLRIRSTKLTVLTDRAMLLRMLENIVANAIKFTRDRVLVAARVRHNRIVIEVHDRGPGIPEDAVDRIFDAFYQTQDEAVGVQRGVGLGLAIVKRLADALGCRVEIKSRRGSGTLMRVVLPESDPIDQKQRGTHGQHD